MTPLIEKAIKVAQSQIGVQERPKGSNGGPEVEIYLKAVGLGKGYSWCMAFVFYCIAEAALKTNSKNLLKRTAGVLDQWNSRPELRITTPVEGCIFIMDLGKGLGHTGFVEKVLPNGQIQTIEGNTNDDGSREGYKVCRHIRSIKTIKGFLKP